MQLGRNVWLLLGREEEVAFNVYLRVGAGIGLGIQFHATNPKIKGIRR